MSNCLWMTQNGSDKESVETVILELSEKVKTDVPAVKDSYRADRDSHGTDHVNQGCQTHFHRGPHQPRGSL